MTFFSFLSQLPAAAEKHGGLVAQETPGTFYTCLLFLPHRSCAKRSHRLAKASSLTRKYFLPWPVGPFGASFPHLFNFEFLIFRASDGLIARLCILFSLSGGSFWVLLFLLLPSFLSSCPFLRLPPFLISAPLQHFHPAPAWPRGVKIANIATGPSHIQTKIPNPTSQERKGSSTQTC